MYEYYVRYVANKQWHLFQSFVRYVTVKLFHVYVLDSINNVARKYT